MNNILASFSTLMFELASALVALAFQINPNLLEVLFDFIRGL